MKKLLMLLTLSTFLFVLSSCEDALKDVITIPEIEDILEDPVVDDTEDTTEDDVDDETEVSFNASEMVQVLSTGRSNFMPDMDQIESDLETGDFMDTDDFVFYDIGCQYGNDYVDNGDGTYTQTFYYYDYDYNYYYMAEEVLYNGIDDDDDGEIDEDDEVLVMVTDEMSDGIDNNYNGVIDEYFEMTPAYFVTYSMTYGEVETTVTNDDGVTTTTGSYTYEWVEVRAPFNNQIIETSNCYVDEETVDPNDEIDYNELEVVYEALLLEVESIVGDLTDVERQTMYLELRLGRTLTTEEIEAIGIVMGIYEVLEDTDVDNDFENEVKTLELYLDRPLTDEERNAFDIYYNYDYTDEEMTPENQAAIELIDALYVVVYERSQIVVYELLLGRSLTEDELLAFEIVEAIRYYDDEGNTISLTDEEIAALDVVTALEVEVSNNNTNDEYFYVMFFLGRPFTDEEKAAFEIMNALMQASYDANDVTIDTFVDFYEDILGRQLTELEIEALMVFELYNDSYFN